MTPLPSSTQALLHRLDQQWEEGAREEGRLHGYRRVPERAMRERGQLPGIRARRRQAQSEDFQIYGRVLIVKKDSLKFSVDTSRLSTGSSWDGKYGGSWSDLAKGWNSITLRYRKSGSKVDLFVNGKPTHEPVVE